MMHYEGGTGTGGCAIRHLGFVSLQSFLDTPFSCVFLKEDV